MFELLKKSEMLIKSSQYMTIPDWVFDMKNDKYAPKGSEQSKLERVFGQNGKLSPEDFERLNNTHNFHVMEHVGDRDDLTPDQIGKILSHSEDFQYGHNRNDIARKNGYYGALAQKLQDHGDEEVTKFLSAAPNHALGKVLRNAPHTVSSSGLMKLVQRHDTLPETVRNMASNPNYDISHATEIIHHPNPEAVSEGLSKVQNLPSTIIDAAMMKNNPKLTSELLSHRSIPFTTAQVNKALQSSDPGVLSNAASRTSTPEQSNYVINNIDKFAKASDDGYTTAFHNFLRGQDYSERASRTSTLFNSDSYHKIIDYAIANPQQKEKTIGDSYFLNKPLQEEHLNRLANLPDTDARIKKEALHHNNSTPITIQSTLDHTKDLNLLQSMAGHTRATPEQLAASFEKAKRDPKYVHSNSFTPWAENPNTDASVVNSIANNLKAIPESHDGMDPRALMHIARNPKLTPDNLNYFIAHPNPAFALAAAKNPSALGSHIDKALKHKDKTVRSEWIKNSNLNPQQMMDVLKDRSSDNIVTLLKRGDIAPEVLHQAATTSKKPEIRRDALRHANVAPETVAHAFQNEAEPGLRASLLDHPKMPPSVVENEFNKKPDVEMADRLSRRDDLSPQLANRVYDVLSTSQSNKRTAELLAMKHPDILDRHIPKLNAEEAKGLLHNHHGEHPFTDNQVTAIYNKISKGDKSAKPGLYLRHLYTHPSFTPEKTAFQHALINGNGSSDINLLDNPHLTNEHISTIINKQNKHPDDWHDIVGTLQEHKKGDSSHIDAILNHPQVKDMMAGDGKINQALSGIIHKHPAFNESHAKTLLEANNPLFRMAALESEKLDTSDVKKLLHDADPAVRRNAGKKVAVHEPDAYNESLDGYKVGIHPATEKLKHLKGLIEAAGGKIHKKDLQGQGFGGAPGEILDGTGHATPESVDKYLNNLPKHEYNVTHGEWKKGGMQMHDDSVDQNVYQINLTNHHIKQLKDQGLFEAFRDMQSLSHRSGHPVMPHTIGWVRADESHPGHIHFDEAQSDFGQSTVRQISDADDSPENQEKAEKLKKVNDIVKGPFKTVNHMLLGAAHQIARQKGAGSTSMDMPMDQAKQSWMDTEKELPGHMQSTYQQYPKDLKYTEQPKKDIMPNTQAEEPTVQYRKLVKSLDLLKFLLGKLK